MSHRNSDESLRRSDERFPQRRCVWHAAGSLILGALASAAFLPTDRAVAQTLSQAERAAQQRDRQDGDRPAAAEDPAQAQRIEDALKAATAAAKAADEAAKEAERAADAARKASAAAADAKARVEALRAAAASAPRVSPPPAGAPRQPPTTPAARPAAPPGGPIVLCVKNDSDESCTHSDLQGAFRAARDGATITIRPGTYYQAGILTAKNVTIQAKGAHLKDTAAQGKAALVLRGGNTTIVGLECSGVQVRDKNGACIRLEMPGLILRNVYFHDNQQGILAGIKTGDILIEDSVFERNGANRGHSHQIYVAGDSLTVRRTRILSATGEGHEVKSRAARTVIEDSVIAALDAQDSRAIDVPNGGEVIVRNNVIERGPKTENHDLVGYGLEISSASGDNSHNTLTMTGNVVLVDGTAPFVWYNARELGGATIKDNVVIGPFQIRTPGNRYFDNRGAAGYPPFPALNKKK